MTILIAAAICAAGVSQVESGLYAPLLRERYHGTPASQMVVKDSAVAMPSLRGSAIEWRREFDDTPSELRRAASEPSPTITRRLERSDLPAGTRLVRAHDVDALFASPDLEANWIAFRTEYNARGWLTFSDGLLAADRLSVLVYYEARCGGTCGEGGYVWLRRETVGSPWRTAKRIVAWMS
jgi:hypothetical protein